VPVKLVLHLSRWDDNRLTGTVRGGPDADVRKFSGILELMRVFEELVPVDRPGLQRDAAGGGRLDGPSGPDIQ